MIPPKSAGAVVIGGDYQGLAIVRSLGRRGLPVHVLDDERSIAALSRYTTRSVRVPDLRDDRSTVDALMGLAERYDLDGAVLFPTREETVAAIARHRDELSQRYRVPTPPWEVIRWAWDKRLTQEKAEELGVPTARTWWPRNAAELDAILHEVQLPAILKPSIKEHFIYVTGDKAWRVDTVEQLTARYAEAAAIAGDGEMMVQELLPVDGRHRLAYCALFKDGEPLASLVARRTRQHPEDFGRASTLVETIEDPQVEEMGRRFLAGIGFYGLVEAEFLLDPRDGRAKLTDVNARTWGYHSIGPAAGVDFPWLLYADQVGLDVEPVRARAGVHWIRLLTDTPTALAEMVHGRLRVRDYVRSLRRAEVEAVFSTEDPAPGLGELVLLPYLIASRGF